MDQAARRRAARRVGRQALPTCHCPPMTTHRSHHCLPLLTTSPHHCLVTAHYSSPCGRLYYCLVTEYYSPPRPRTTRQALFGCARLGGPPHLPLRSRPRPLALRHPSARGPVQRADRRLACGALPAPQRGLPCTYQYSAPLATSAIWRRAHIWRDLTWRGHIWRDLTWRRRR